jgi:hypothetical protein
VARSGRFDESRDWREIGRRRKEEEARRTGKKGRRRTKEKKKAVSGRTKERNGQVLDAEEPVGPWEVRCSR